MSALTTTAAPIAIDHDLLTRREVAALLRIHKNTVSKIGDKLPPLRVAPGVLRWRRADVEAYLNGLATAG